MNQNTDEKEEIINIDEKHKEYIDYKSIYENTDNGISEFVFRCSTNNSGINNVNPNIYNKYDLKSVYKKQCKDEQFPVNVNFWRKKFEELYGYNLKMTENKLLELCKKYNPFPMLSVEDVMRNWIKRITYFLGYLALLIALDDIRNNIFLDNKPTIFVIFINILFVYVAMGKLIESTMTSMEKYDEQGDFFFIPRVDCVKYSSISCGYTYHTQDSIEKDAYIWILIERNYGILKNYENCCSIHLYILFLIDSIVLSCLWVCNIVFHLVYICIILFVRIMSCSTEIGGKITQKLKDSIDMLKYRDRYWNF